MFPVHLPTASRPPAASERRRGAPCIMRTDPTLPHSSSPSAAAGASAGAYNSANPHTAPQCCTCAHEKTENLKNQTHYEVGKGLDDDTKHIDQVRSR